MLPPTRLQLTVRDEQLLEARYRTLNIGRHFFNSSAPKGVATELMLTLCPEDALRVRDAFSAMLIELNEGTTDEIYNERETAKILKIEVDTLRHWRRAGRGPKHQRVNNMVRYRREEIDRFVGA
jgi:hypothetical protein